MSEHLPECNYTVDMDGPPLVLTPCTCPADLDSYRQGQRDREQELLGGVPLEEHDRRIIVKNYEQGQRDERSRIRQFIVGLTTTEHTRHVIDTILWHIDKGDNDGD